MPIKEVEFSFTTKQKDDVSVRMSGLIIDSELISLAIYNTNLDYPFRSILLTKEEAAKLGLALLKVAD